MAAASKKSRRIWPRPAASTFFVADLGEARRVRSVASEPAIYVLNGIMPGTAAAYPDIRARPVIGSMVELAEWDAFCSGQDWHGGAALHVDTGMNRLGISVNEAAALAHRIRAENHGITLLDEPPCLRRTAGASAQRAADQRVPRGAHSLSRHPLLARQFVRRLSRAQAPIATWCARASRFTASIRSRGRAIRCAR